MDESGIMKNAAKTSKRVMESLLGEKQLPMFQR